MKRKILSFIITIVSVVFLLINVILLSDKPFHFHKKNDKKYFLSAIVIRDNVTPFQKIGSRIFTVPYLREKYGHYAYFTQYYKDDKKEAFTDSLYRFLNRYDSVDLYLLAHANYYYSWLDTFPKNLLKKIRMVYNTGCGDANQANLWLSMGVSSYIGHNGLKSQSPVFYFFFLRRITASDNIKTAVEDANLMTERFFSIFSFFYWQFSQTDLIEGTKGILYKKF